MSLSQENVDPNNQHSSHYKMPSLYQQPLLPQKRDYTLVLDMDETMIHFDQRRNQFKARPHLQVFLQEASVHWEIIVFTAALKDYANWILNDVDPQKLITRRLYRDSCTFRRGTYLKDLNKIGKDLSKVVIVDNLPENFSLQQNNGIGIKSWFNDNKNDKELLKLAKVLQGFVGCSDVREGVKAIGGRLNARLEGLA